jgi:hypothetical protein
MNHSCHKCGHTIEDGRPFCSECGAPQIRVILPEAPAPALAADGAAVGGNLAAEPVFPSDAASPVPASWSHSLRPSALAAAVAILLTLLGLNPFVGAFGAGWLTVALSRHRGAATTLRPATGARLGAMSGLVLFGLSTLFETLAVVVLHKGGELRDAMLDKIQQVSSRYPSPQVQPFIDFVKTPEGFAFMMAGSVIFGLLAFIALGSVGGAVGAAFLGRRRS